MLGCTGAVDDALEVLSANPPDTARMTKEEHAAALRSRRAALAANRMMPYAEGILTVTHLLDAK